MLGSSKYALLLVFIPVLSFFSAARADDAKPAKRPMTVEDLWKLKRLGPPSMSPDGKWVVVEVTSFNMDENESTSDLWLLATDGKTQRQLTTHKSRDQMPKWSPDRKSIAFVSKRDTEEPQIYVISPEGGEARRVSNMPTGPAHLKWSADSKTIFCIAWSWHDTPDDESFKKKAKELKENKVQAYIIDDATYRYWDKWIADGKRPMVFAIDTQSGKHKNLLAGTKMNLPPYEPSDKDYDVSPDGTELCFVAENVKEIGMDINHDLFTMALDQTEAKPKSITEDNPANDTNPVYSPDGKHIAFLRQTTKFFYADQTRLMIRDHESGSTREIAPDFERSCASPVWLPDGRRIAVEVEDSGLVNIGFAALNPGKIVILKEDASERSISFPKEVRLGAYLRTTFDEPPTLYVHGPDMEPRRIDKFNDDLSSQWKLGKAENVTIKGADEKDVQMWVVYPPDFDPAKKWPLVQMVHGGPHNAIVNEFHFRWNPQLWAAQGWVVGIVNFHGSSGFGQAFTDSITGDYGAKPLTDVMKATDWFEKQPWIDKDRMAAAGASYGGYMMAYLNGHTDRFKAMVCHAGVYNYAGQMASDIVVGRRRALGGFPWDDYGRNDKQSANRYAQNFKTPTLVLHGEKDYRVPVTQGFEYYNTLKMKGVPARLVYFPDENHWIQKPQNSRLWHKEVFAWLEKYVRKGPS